jgi:kelch-like protein 20
MNSYTDIFPLMFSHMYAVGGQDGVSCLNIVERYDPKENRWTRVAPMSTRRLGVAVAVLNGFLYAVGGSDGTSPLNTVERYDPSANHWKAMPSMGTRRKHLGVSAFQDKLFAGMYFELNLNQIIKTSQISEHYQFCCF